MSNNVTQDLQVTAYKELVTESLDPEIQVSAKYDLPIDVDSVVTGTGTAEVTGGEFVVTSNGAFDFSAIFSERLIISRPGQGSVTRFTARIDQGVVGSRLSAGVTSAGDGMSFAYIDGVFGVAYDHGGLNSINELQITTPAGGAENATVTLDGTVFIVPLTSGTPQHNAVEIVNFINANTIFFTCSQNDDVVIVRGVFAFPAVGVFGFSSATAVGVFTEIEEGLVAANEFVAQADWNENKKPDLDPQKINCYTIRWNGAIEYFIKDEATGEEILVHMFKLPNTRVTAMFSVNAFRVTWGAFSTGAADVLSVRGTQGAAFNEGRRKLLTQSKASFSIVPSLGGSLVNIITIKCRDVFGNKSNQSRVIPMLVDAAVTGNNKNVLVEIIRNATFSSAVDPDYSYHDKDSSIVQVSTAKSVVTGGEIVGSFALSPDDSRSLRQAGTDHLTMNETLTLAMTQTGGSTADAEGSIIWKEDI